MQTALQIPLPLFHKAGKSQSWTGDKPQRYSPEIRWTSNEEKLYHLTRGIHTFPKAQLLKSKRYIHKGTPFLSNRNSIPILNPWPLSSLESIHPGRNLEVCGTPDRRRSPYRAHTRSPRKALLILGVARVDWLHGQWSFRHAPKSSGGRPWKQAADIQPAVVP